MPVAALEKDDAARSGYLKGLFDEVYIKDIRERYGIRDDTAISAVLDVLSSDIGSLTNPHRIGNTMASALKLRISDNTLKAYMEHLEDAFLFTKARRYEVKGRKYIDSPCKYYSMDLGLRNARLNFRDTDMSHPMENAIYNELILRGYNVDVGVVPIVSRKNGVKETRQHEIDFIVNRETGVRGIMPRTFLTPSGREMRRNHFPCHCPQGRSPWSHATVLRQLRLSSVSSMGVAGRVASKKVVERQFGLDVATVFVRLEA